MSLVHKRSTKLLYSTMMHWSRCLRNSQILQKQTKYIKSTIGTKQILSRDASGSEDLHDLRSIKWRNLANSIWLMINKLKHKRKFSYSPESRILWKIHLKQMERISSLKINHGKKIWKLYLNLPFNKQFI